MKGKINAKQGKKNNNNNKYNNKKNYSLKIYYIFILCEMAARWQPITTNRKGRTKRCTLSPGLCSINAL